MPIEFKCEMCGAGLGEMNKGRLRNKSVLLCEACWKRASIAVLAAETARAGAPDFLNDVLRGFDKS